MTQAIPHAPRRVQISATRRDVLIVTSFAATAAGAAMLSNMHGAQQPEARGSLEQLIPDEIGPWTRSITGGYDIPRGEEAGSRSYDEVLTRYYTSSGNLSVMLLIAYGRAQTGSTQLHRPEVCYSAAGFRLKHWPNVRIKLDGGRDIPARHLTAAAAGRIEQILYWSRVGDDFPLGSMQQRWAVIRQALHGHSPDGALVRISAISNEPARTLEILRSFARALVTSVEPASAALLAGNR